MRLISLGMHRWFDHASGLTTFFYRLIFTITQAVKDSRFLLPTTGKFRRFWLVHFQKEYIKGQILAREGDCRQFGACCNLLFTCPMLTKPGRCFVYGSCRPQACKVFPIDRRDIDEINLCGGHCGYRFNNEDSLKICIIGRYLYVSPVRRLDCKYRWPVGVSGHRDAHGPGVFFLSVSQRGGDPAGRLPCRHRENEHRDGHSLRHLGKPFRGTFQLLAGSEIWKALF